MHRSLNNIVILQKKFQTRSRQRFWVQFMLRMFKPLAMSNIEDICTIIYKYPTHDRKASSEKLLITNEIWWKVQNFPKTAIFRVFPEKCLNFRNFSTFSRGFRGGEKVGKKCKKNALFCTFCTFSVRSSKMGVFSYRISAFLEKRSLNTNLFLRLTSVCCEKMSIMAVDPENEIGLTFNETGVGRFSNVNESKISRQPLRYGFRVPI